MQEEWKPIPGYEGLYDASNMGRIRSHPGRLIYNGITFYEAKTKILVQRHLNKRGDYTLSLCKNSKSKQYLVSRLVASAWHGVPQDGMTVNHINGNIFDNRAVNLEWCTRSENVYHSYRIGLRPLKSTKTVLYDEDENCFEFTTMAEANRFLGRCNNYIHSFNIRGKNTCTDSTGKKYRFLLGGEV